jgi:hypothetical protein
MFTGCPYGCRPLVVLVGHHHGVGVGDLFGAADPRADDVRGMLEETFGLPAGS